MLNKKKEISKMLLIISLMTLFMIFIHENVHIIQMHNKGKITEICYLGWEQGGLGGWVQTEIDDNIYHYYTTKQAHMDLELQAEIISSVAVLFIGSFLIFKYTEKMEAEIE